jgi:CheY-like chemotaxis protein
MLERMVLRAELVHEGRCIVAHTTAVTESSVVVRTDERIALGDSVVLRLSFPRLFAPLQLTARVASRDAGSGHGYYAGFTLEFAADERLSRLVQPDEDAPSQGAFHILLVEDSPVMCDVVTQGAATFSRTFRITTTSAFGAEAALELIERERFDLAVVDLFLPGPLDGAGLVRDLRARKLDLPVIGVSIGGPKARHAFLDAGADLFLDKPIALRDVFATLERLSVAAARSHV